MLDIDDMLLPPNAQYMPTLASACVAVPQIALFPTPVEAPVMRLAIVILNLPILSTVEWDWLC